MVRKETAITREKVGGTGLGQIFQYDIETKETLRGHGRMFAKLVLPKGSTIGWHQHVGESETYYILSGKGAYKDNDGTVTEVTTGDICTVNVGDYHCIDNIGDEDLVFIALIYNDYV